MIKNITICFIVCLSFYLLGSYWCHRIDQDTNSPKTSKVMAEAFEPPDLSYEPELLRKDWRNRVGG